MKLQKFQKLQYHSMGNDMMREKMEKEVCNISHASFYVCIFMFVFLCLY